MPGRNQGSARPGPCTEQANARTNVACLAKRTSGPIAAANEDAIPAARLGEAQLQASQLAAV
jgi:hypothetical protein